MIPVLYSMHNTAGANFHHKMPSQTNNLSDKAPFSTPLYTLLYTSPFRKTRLLSRRQTKRKKAHPSEKNHTGKGNFIKVPALGNLRIMQNGGFYRENLVSARFFKSYEYRAIIVNLSTNWQFGFLQVSRKKDLKLHKRPSNLLIDITWAISSRSIVTYFAYFRQFGFKQRTWPPTKAK